MEIKYYWRKLNEGKALYVEIQVGYKSVFLEFLLEYIGLIEIQTNIT
ncbi:MAG: hypothetical protein QXX94_07865 [Candidatus Bathyarchaeia archaeon]